MRILSVRGKNLASLAGHFEVDFAKGALEQAGLIAITGPTGAGKTTILDAMCLALFDRTPRFANRGGVVIGAVASDQGAGLRATDVRGILRHGAVEGWAEVDFLGVDGRSWRARWEVRRARGRAEGRIQHQQMKLIDPVDGRVLAADRKGDTLAAIEARLGLDFDQFRRSVLLAQGEFAAFLEANGGERAELLERMTGTSLYRELGRGAFERAKRAERERELVTREREQLRILPEARRVELGAAVAIATDARRQLERGRAEAEGALRWYQRARSLTAARASARASLAEFDEQRRSLEQKEVLLGRVERVAALRERIQTRDRWARELREREGDLAFVNGELPLIATQLEELDARLELSEQQLERASERRRRLTPEIDRARELDTRTSGAVAERERLEAKVARARTARAATDAQLVHIEAGIGDAQARLAQDRGWLDEHAGLAQLADDWVHYHSLLQQQLRWIEARGALDQRVAELGPRRELGERVLGVAKAELEGVAKLRTPLLAKIRKLARELDDRPGLAQLRHRQAALDSCRDQLSGLRTMHEKLKGLVLVGVELRREHGDQKLERDHQSAERRRVAAELQRTELGFVEVQRGLRQLEAVRDVVQHRADLRHGEACPLCGATEHPAADDLAPVETVVRTQRERVDALLRARYDLQHEQGEHVSREDLAKRRIVTIDARLRALEAEQGALALEWAECSPAGPLLPEEGGGEGALAAGAAASEQLSLLGAPAGRALTVPERLDSPTLEHALWAVEEELDHRAAKLDEERGEVEALLERQRGVQAQREQADLDYEASRTRRRSRSRELDELSRGLDEAQGRALSLDAELDAHWLELDDVGPAALQALARQDSGVTPESAALGVAEFRAQLTSAGEELLARFVDGVQRALARRRSSRQTVEGLQELATRRAEFGSQRQARVEVCAAVELELVQLDGGLEGLRKSRGQLLGGAPVAELVRELEASVEIAGRDREASKDARVKVERALQARQTRAHALAEQLSALGSSRDAAQRSVESGLAEGLGGGPGGEDVDQATVDELLARPELWAEGWLSRTRAFVEETRAEHARRRAVLGERERVVTEHELEGPPTLTRELAKQRRAQLDERDESLRAQLFELEHELRRDSEDRALAEALAPRQRELQHAARVWGRLRDAIGSASGDKFQKFAQSLTLELLLAQANAQLRDLKPRYSLARVPNHDLELQLVDHDLGDEVRSIRGLSGGEKFLVSLALALALASLSANDCRIDSLFIDEGFGTLDAHSLDVAVSTLDALQAEGRQIGVISHVSGLAERVGVEVRVEPVSSGRSRVRVVSLHSASPS